MWWHVQWIVHALCLPPRLQWSWVVAWVSSARITSDSLHHFFGGVVNSWSLHTRTLPPLPKFNKHTSCDCLLDIWITVSEAVTSCSSLSEANLHQQRMKRKHPETLSRLESDFPTNVSDFWNLPFQTSLN